MTHQYFTIQAGGGTSKCRHGWLLQSSTRPSQTLKRLCSLGSFVWWLYCSWREPPFCCNCPGGDGCWSKKCKNAKCCWRPTSILTILQFSSSLLSRQLAVWSHLSSMSMHCPSLQVNSPFKHDVIFTCFTLEASIGPEWHLSSFTPAKSTVWTPTKRDASGDELIATLLLSLRSYHTQEPPSWS